jgi:uncharacterized protein (DUF58 family)
MGDEFWQYRPAAGDEARMIDWRRSGRSDAHFVREREWQAAQSVLIWVDDGARWRFPATEPPPRAPRAASGAGAGDPADPGRRAGGADRADGAAAVGAGAGDAAGRGAGRDGSAPITASARPEGMPPQSRAVFLSDFLGDLAPVEAALTHGRRPRRAGALVQVLDPVEEDFPFDGRTIFEACPARCARDAEGGRSAHALSGPAGRAQGPAGGSGPADRLAATPATTPAPRRRRRCCGFTRALERGR